MATRIFGPTRSRQRRRFLLAPIFLVAAVALLLTTGAQAVHDVELFELDANVLDQAAAGDDWSNIFAGTDSAIVDTGIVADPAPQTIFTGGGSKDDLDVPQWKHKDGSVPDKDDITNAYAAAYRLSGDTYLYFGLDRFAVQGSANVGFWFFQDDVAPIAGGTFSGQHVIGDLLVLSEFDEGGGGISIKVFVWVGTGGDEGGGTLQTLIGGETGLPADCDTVGAGDDVCANVNTSPILDADIPWDYVGKGGTRNMPTAAFFEGGLNLSELLPGAGCFSNVLAETRSSFEVNAVLKDFAHSSFPLCVSGTETTPLDGAGNPISGPLSIGTGSVSVRDRAVVTVEGATTFDGNVTFFLCKLDSPDLCDDTDAAHHGTQIGSPQTISQPSPVTVTSDAAIVTSAGRYCWRAVYSGDEAADVPGSSDSRASECFTVNPVTPTLTTQASGPVSLGNAISDTATLTGTANQPGTPVINPTTAGGPAGGTITFTAFGPNDCTTVAFTTTRAVSGDGTYPTAGQAAVSFVPTAVGTYTWVASYSGDSPNTNAVSASACPDPTGTETVVVTDTTTTVTAQNWLPNDSATIASAGGSALSGSVTFTLYNNGTCDPGVGGANVLYTEGPIAVSGASPQIRSTNNTTVKVLASATVSWRAVYTSDSPNVGGSSSTCETTVLTITN